MTWVKLDDAVSMHPKLRKAGGEAAWLWVCGIALCNRQKTGGLVEHGDLPALFPGGGWGKRKLRNLASKLVEAGLWTEVAEGFRVHDYEDYQPAAMKPERTDEDRRKDRERQAKHRAKVAAETNAEQTRRESQTNPARIPAESRAKTNSHSYGNETGNGLKSPESVGVSRRDTRDFSRARAFPDPVPDPDPSLLPSVVEIRARDGNEDSTASTGGPAPPTPPDPTPGSDPRCAKFAAAIVAQPGLAELRDPEAMAEAILGEMATAGWRTEWVLAAIAKAGADAAAERAAAGFLDAVTVGKILMARVRRCREIWRQRRETPAIQTDEAERAAKARRRRESEDRRRDAEQRRKWAQEAEAEGLSEPARRKARVAQIEAAIATIGSLPKHRGPRAERVPGRVVPLAEAFRPPKHLRRAGKPVATPEGHPGPSDRASGPGDQEAS